MDGRRVVLVLAVMVCVALAWGAATTRPGVGEEVKVGRLHNVHRLTDRIWAGSGPEGEEDFKGLAGLGVKTVISVDGARPGVEEAEKAGLRYVHLPVGYEGFGRERVLELSKAVRDLPGAVYIHCHHGKHRGPAAACAVAVALEGWRPERAVEAMKELGTGAQYKGLYETVMKTGAATKEEIDRADGTLPAMAEVKGIVKAMVEIDELWDRIKRGDGDRGHAALLLKEQFREMGRTSVMKEDYVARLKKAEETAGSLETAIGGGEKGAIEKGVVEMGKVCAGCHEVYRDCGDGTGK